ncbi:MAG: type IV secretion system protein [Rickettsia sp.]|nr:type IV secretion system protein [Rickettsia sp.]
MKQILLQVKNLIYDNNGIVIFVLVLIATFVTIILFFVGFILSLLMWGECYNKIGGSVFKSAEISLIGNGNENFQDIGNNESDFSKLFNNSFSGESSDSEPFDKSLYYKWKKVDFFEKNSKLRFKVDGKISLKTIVYKENNSSTYNNVVIPRVNSQQYLQLPFEVGKKLVLFPSLSEGDQVVIFINKESNEGIKKLSDVIDNKLLTVNCSDRVLIEDKSPADLLLCGKIIYYIGENKNVLKEFLPSLGKFKFKLNNNLNLLFSSETIDAEQSNNIPLNSTDNKFQLQFSDQNYVSGIDVKKHINSKIEIQQFLPDDETDFSTSQAHGGFVFNIQHTSFYTTAAGYSNKNIGKIEYYISNDSTDPNKDSSVERTGFFKKELNNDDNSVNYIVDMSSAGELWVRVHLEGEYLENIQDVSGAYNIFWSKKEEQLDFIEKFFFPIVEKIFLKLEDGMSYLQRMVCVIESNDLTIQHDTTNCQNLFIILRILLVLYVIFYGFSFLLGLVEINQQDLVIRFIKIAFIASVINGQISSFINDYILDFVLNFSDIILDKIVINPSSKFTGNAYFLNHFNFASDFLNKIFYNSFFWKQMISLMGKNTVYLNLVGGTFFMIVLGGIKVIFILTSCAILMIVLLETMVVSVFAKILLILLFTMAPIFLVGLLFDVTRTFFSQWINSIIIFTLLPIVLVGGIFIIIRLFINFLEQETAFSICSRCAFPFTLDELILIFIPLFPLAYPILFTVQIALSVFPNNPINQIVFFCLPYFQPWGYHYALEDISNLTEIDIFSELYPIFLLFIISMMAREYNGFITSILQTILSSEFSMSDTSKNFSNKINNSYQFLRRRIGRDIIEYRKNKMQKLSNNNQILPNKSLVQENTFNNSQNNLQNQKHNADFGISSKALENKEFTDLNKKSSKILENAKQNIKNKTNNISSSFFNKKKDIEKISRVNINNDNNINNNSNSNNHKIEMEKSETNQKHTD